MGNHSKWRREAKKQRRKRIRQRTAIERKAILEEERKRLEASPNYQRQCLEQEALDRWQAEEDARLNRLEHEKWLERDKQVQMQWQQLQERLQKARDEKRRQEQIIRDEWEREQKLVEEKRAEKQALIEQQLQHELEMNKKIDQFLMEGNDADLPDELATFYHSNPGKELCPFFEKTGVCRFGDGCSRDHVRPIISRILLVPSFYTNFCMEHSNQNEYDADISLEYDDGDTYLHFTEFYGDVCPEFTQVGALEKFYVCRNHEPHLRGNVYIEFQQTKDALKAYRSFHGRWYGGKQLNLHFINIPSWKSAICGLFFINKCPKGRGCNFLHVFKNPGNQYQNNRRGDYHRKSLTQSNPENNLSKTRWSESPEIENIEYRMTEKKSRRKPHGSRRRRYKDEEENYRRKYDDEKESRYRSHHRRRRRRQSSRDRS